MDSFCNKSTTIPVGYFEYRQSLANELAADGEPMPNIPFAGPHNHAEMEILLFIKGSGDCKLGVPGDKISFGEGDILIVNPFEVHSGIYWGSAMQQNHLCLDFPISLLENPHIPLTQHLSEDLFSRTVRCENLISVENPLYPELRAAFEGMYRSILPQSKNDLLFLEELIRFFRVLYDGNCIHHAKQSPISNRNVEFVKNVLQYIDEHFGESITTRDISTAMKYSKEYFCRLFKSCFSVAFTDYLTQYRIEKAKLMLADHSSSEVSALCGFSTQSLFSKVFRESVGLSPNKYRQYLSNEQEG